MYSIRSNVIAHIDLTEPFGTRSPWSFVVAKQPDEDGVDFGGVGWREGAVSVCFVKDADPDCSETLFRNYYRQHKIPFAESERPLYQLRTSRIVLARDRKPLLLLQGCTAHGGNGSCGITTFVFAYDRAHDRFSVAFSEITGSNNNQATRFIESGPLQGDVVVVYPTPDAPFVYEVEVHRLGGDGRYALMLKYRGHTGYGDGNPLPVIDSEMPSILQHLGYWKAGDAPPTPPALPAGCTRVFMRRGVEWCG